tara:strand:- start:128 stop:427 length:300 start_codon:yes stop_codon:yes gene_type:complete
MEKVNFNKGVKLIISPTETGYACGLINEEIDMNDEGLYLCHIIAQGMIKFAMTQPQEAFNFGVDQAQESQSNGELKRFDDYENVVDISDFLKKNKKRLH